MIPEGFAIVERNVYRSATIQQQSFPFINNKNIKTILLLSPEPPTKVLMQWIEDSHINLIHFGQTHLKNNNGWASVSEELVKESLQIVLDVTMHPILIMDTTGFQETGILIGCLRKLQDWNFNSIIVEYRSFARNKSKYFNEQFIELFDTELITLPKELPQWFSINQ